MPKCNELFKCWQEIKNQHSIFGSLSFFMFRNETSREKTKLHEKWLLQQCVYRFWTYIFASNEFSREISVCKRGAYVQSRRMRSLISLILIFHASHMCNRRGVEQRVHIGRTAKDNFNKFKIAIEIKTPKSINYRFMPAGKIVLLPTVQCNCRWWHMYIRRYEHILRAASNLRWRNEKDLKTV